MTKKLLGIFVALLAAMSISITGCQGRSADSAPAQSASDINLPESGSMETDATQKVSVAAGAESAGAAAVNGADDSDAPDITSGALSSDFTLSHSRYNPNGPEEFTEQSASFSVNFPEDWELEVTKYQIIIKKAESNIAVVELDSRTDINENGVGGKIVSSRAISVSDCPGTLYTTEASVGGKVLSLYSVILAPEELPDIYVCFYFLPGSGTEAEVEAIVNSFHMN